VESAFSTLYWKVFDSRCSEFLFSAISKQAMLRHSGFWKRPIKNGVLYRGPDFAGTSGHIFT
jgi:hypothetical protein